MCGIAGIFNLDGQPVSSIALRRMTDAIAHRGPDGEGYFTDALRLLTASRREGVVHGFKWASPVETVVAGSKGPMRLPVDRFTWRAFRPVPPAGSSNSSRSRPGGTVAMYERDKSACENAILEGPTSGAQSDNYSWEGCMENKGWIVLDKPAM